LLATHNGLFDAGKTWHVVSRAGEQDFQAPPVSGNGLAGFDGQLRTSVDGIMWTKPTATFALAVLAGSPASAVVLATTHEGLQRSTDHGNAWRLAEGAPSCSLLPSLPAATRLPRSPPAGTGSAANCP
jgi:hypothetical protein